MHLLRLGQVPTTKREHYNRKRAICRNVVSSGDFITANRGEGLVLHKTWRTSASDQLAKLSTSFSVGSLQIYVICVSFLFWPIAHSLPIISARSRRRSTARVRHGRNDAHEALVHAGPVFAPVATQTAPRTSPGPLRIFGFSSHKLSSEASF